MAEGRGGSGMRWGRFVFVYLFIHFEHLNSSRDAPGCFWEPREPGSAKAPHNKVRANVLHGRERQRSLVSTRLSVLL